jgi:hypothetical protein
VQKSNIKLDTMYIYIKVKYRKPSFNLPWAAIRSPPELSRELAPIGY